MSLLRLPLGFAPECGKKSVDQAVAFKRAMREKLGSVDDAYLMVVGDRERFRTGVEAVCLEGEPAAESWARKALDAAPEVWKQVSHGRSRGRCG